MQALRYLGKMDLRRHPLRILLQKQISLKEASSITLALRKISFCTFTNIAEE